MNTIEYLKPIWLKFFHIDCIQQILPNHMSIWDIPVKTIFSHRRASSVASIGVASRLSWRSGNQGSQGHRMDSLSPKGGEKYAVED